MNAIGGVDGTMRTTAGHTAAEGRTGPDGHGAPDLRGTDGHPGTGPDGQSAPAERGTDEPGAGHGRAEAAGSGDATAVWRARAADASPADRAAAEEGVALAYRRAGLVAPERIVWAGSPREAVTLIRAMTDTGPSVRDAVRTAPWAAERARLHQELGAAGWSAHWGSTGGRLWETTHSLVDRIRQGVLDDLLGEAPVLEPGSEAQAPERLRRSRAEAEIRLILLDAVLGQHDAPWLAAFPTDRAPLDGLGAVCGSAGWWWPFARVAVVCERPVALRRDEAGRLDNGDGPALAYPDGFALYAWRGMPVPAAFLAELATLTPERIRAEENAELRRVMLEYYGYDRYLTDSGARPIDRDETGTLWRIALEGDEAVVMVEVLNSTPEPDGTVRTYWLRVPPTTRTAREGVAWTFGVSEAEYRPMRET
ncbi:MULTISPECIES: DUF6745 domain-containing protein [Streptomyces]|uniref:DUF6745 domain-containing protein n=1 Tax=Streptomyces doudnae TaxID=3075536 RepID=A0ABD5ETI9_9ACTN|nr:MULTISPECIES: hypothetical protein [unclassified Streptomyces]MDT0437309.1 hypothetical protein [Streptomyces sp. DSM 41981]SCE17621.1 hypothetical protein GA0115242_12476 [Streptomyces sp. SolWspMP-5a-2]